MEAIEGSDQGLNAGAASQRGVEQSVQASYPSIIYTMDLVLVA